MRPQGMLLLACLLVSVHPQCLLCDEFDIGLFLLFDLGGVMILPPLLFEFFLWLLDVDVFLLIDFDLFSLRDLNFLLLFDISFFLFFDIGLFLLFDLDFFLLLDLLRLVDLLYLVALRERWLCSVRARLQADKSEVHVLLDFSRDRDRTDDTSLSSRF